MSIKLELASFSALLVSSLQSDLRLSAGAGSGGGPRENMNSDTAGWATRAQNEEVAVEEVGATLNAGRVFAGRGISHD